MSLVMLHQPDHVYDKVIHCQKNNEKQSPIGFLDNPLAAHSSTIKKNICKQSPVLNSYYTEPGALLWRPLGFLSRRRCVQRVIIARFACMQPGERLIYCRFPPGQADFQ